MKKSGRISITNEIMFGLLFKLVEESFKCAICTFSMSISITNPREKMIKTRFGQILFEIKGSITF